MSGPRLTIPAFPRSAQHLPRIKGLVLLIALCPVACVRRLPPAPTPQEVVPSLDVSAPPQTGMGRVVVDVVEGPTPVLRIEMRATPADAGQGPRRFRLIESPQLLCAASPCVLDVPVGNVLLGFPVIGDPGATEVELVHVGLEPTVYRRSLSVYENHSGKLRVLGIIGTSLGSVSAITGIVLLPIGLSDDSDGLTTAGGITLAVGVVLVAVGIWAIRRDSPTYRPGSASHFSLPPVAPGPRRPE